MKKDNGDSKEKIVKINSTTLRRAVRLCIINPKTNIVWENLSKAPQEYCIRRAMEYLSEFLLKKDMQKLKNAVMLIAYALLK